MVKIKQQALSRPPWERMMKIDLKSWSESIETMAGTVLPKEITISADPHNYFDGFFCEVGYPFSSDFYPIWSDNGVIISVELAQTFVFDLDGSRWKKLNDPPCHRVFWISETGILGEVDNSNGRVTEFFPVSDPNTAAEYIAMICGKQLERGSRPKDREVQIKDIVADSYVHFFRYPDDLTHRIEEMPWVSTRPLGELVNLYIDKSVSWLDPFIGELWRLENRSKIKREPKSAKTIKSGEEMISKDEHALRLVQRLNEQFGVDASPLRQACLKAAACLEDADVLNASDAWRLQIYQIPYAIHDSIADLVLDVGVLPVKEVFVDFLSREVNPLAWETIRKHVLLSLLDDDKDESNVHLVLPSIAEQRRRAFEALAYRHAIDRSSHQLSQFQAGKENARELHGLLANRYLEVTTILERMPTHDAELERAHSPLPYFVEAPLIAWERAAENLKIQNGFMAFGNLLRQIVLFGLAEIQAPRKQWSDFVPPPPDVIAGIRANPSLGHWSKCLDWLGRYANALPMFGGWIQAMEEHRTQTIELTELRNKYAHPTSVLERAFVENIKGQLEVFFTDVVRKLRREEGVRVILPLSRRALKRKKGIIFEFIGLNLCSSYDRFREASIELSAEGSGSVIEGEILAISNGVCPQLLSLQAFFRAKELTPDRYAVLLYEKAFDGKSGIFSAVDSEVQDKLPMPNCPLEFF
jgi:hypothetical protein